MSTTGRCPYCRRAGTGEPCNPACPRQAPDIGPLAGVWSSPAHAKKAHPLWMAHSPTSAASGTRVYVVCGFGGCQQRLEVDAAVWRAEEARRH